jgi:uncharacterized damage-inducible protein DinB
MRRIFRKGPIGALIDEYERAALELKRTVEQISEDDFVRIIDPQTSDENCRSIRSIMTHVVSSGYGYADHIRQMFSISSGHPPVQPSSRQESIEQLASMLEYTAQAMEGKWEMRDEEIEGITMETGWGVTYNLEQVLEHAIVHLLRHRRQIEKFISEGEIAARSAV